MGSPIGGLHPTGFAADAQPGLGPLSETLTAPVLPEGMYASMKGLVFSASQAIAGVAPGTSGTTTTPNFTIYNGDNAGSPTIKLVLWDVFYGYVSGTIGAGTIAGSLGVSAAAPTGGTAITSYPLNGASGASALVSCGTGHTVTALAAGTDREVVVSLAATLATAPAAGVGDPVNYGPARVLNRVIPAGSFYALAGVTAAGSSPLLRCTVRYIVYPIAASPSQM